MKKNKKFNFVQNLKVSTNHQISYWTSISIELVLVRSRTKFERDNSKFAQVRKFRANFQKIQNLRTP